MQKLKIVADYAPSYKYLNVCLKDGNNCGRFEKCARTMTGLDALGKLDYYREVFDVDYYNSHHHTNLHFCISYNPYTYNKDDYFLYIFYLLFLLIL